MTFILTALAAIVVTALRFSISFESAKCFHVGFLALMYWGAALMWAVDGFFVMAEGEPFVELTDPAVVADDALLGACVIVLGFVVWGIVNVVKRITTSKSASAV